MGTIAEEDVTGNLFTLLKETFEGPPPGIASAFLDQGGGLFQTLDGLTAEEASRVVRPGAPTIVAHCAHARFYVSVLEKYARGSSEHVDWKESWLVQTISPEEWQTFKAELADAYAS